MSFFDVYIDHLDDLIFVSNSKSKIVDELKSSSPNFPPANPSLSKRYFEWIEENGYKYKKTDWAAWVTLVNKEQIKNFITLCYADDPSYNDPSKMLACEGKPYLVNRLLELRVYVANLHDNKLYKLVACET